MAKKSAALRDAGDAELVQRLADARQELFNLRFENVTGKLGNTARISQVRKDVARIATVLREREIEAAEQLAADERNASNA
jgi:large subunit ribosomal protein L29